MPLVDHFHPPISTLHRWESFHNRWANTLADHLNDQLPAPRFLVEVQMTLGTRIEADVAEHDLGAGSSAPTNGAQSEPVQTWTAPVAVRSLAFSCPDDLEVQVFDSQEGKTLVGVIGLVSPANKDRPDHRRAFAGRCLSYLQRGIGVLVADIVSERRSNLHHALLTLLGETSPADLPKGSFLYAVAYRPSRREESNLLDLWTEPLVLGQGLPVLPLALKGLFCVPVDLEETYTGARERCRI